MSDSASASDPRPSVREELRAAKRPKYDIPLFDTDAAPENPAELFRDWLTGAIAAGVSQPEVMTLATASAAGEPSARSVLLKDVTAEGFWFASLDSGPKGADLRENPRAALTFYWREVGRQVRVTGAVRPGSRELSERDFTARHPVARAETIAGEQSTPLPDAATLERDLADAREKADAGFVPLDWTVFVVEPDMVEFWQSAPGHGQLRMRFDRASGAAGWQHELIWP